jgi:sugar lactone lactonase YvrE
VAPPLQPSGGMTQRIWLTFFLSGCLSPLAEPIHSNGVAAPSTATDGATVAPALDGGTPVNDAGGSDGATLSEGTPTLSVFAGMMNHAGEQDGKGEAAMFDTPDRITTDGQGNLWVRDDASGGSNVTIRKIDASGNVTSVKSPNGTTSWSSWGDGPYGNLAADSSGTLWVGAQSSTIQKVAANGSISTVTFNNGSPRAFCFDNAGSAFLLEDGAGFAQLDLQTGNFTQLFSVGGAGEIFNPVYDHGAIYISGANLANPISDLRIFKLDPTKQSNPPSAPFAGAGGNVSSKDGAGQAAQFASNNQNEILRFAGDGNGTLYVNDLNTIRKVDLQTANVTTIVSAAGLDGLAFTVAGAIAWTPGNTLYITDQKQHVIYRLTAADKL